MTYIIFDLEATCWDNNVDKLHEVIEVGATMFTNEHELVGHFSRFVKPVINPTLSTFCKELTHIQQSDVDSAKSFEEIMNEFATWCISNSNDVVLCSWGFYDKNQIKSEAEYKKLNGEILSLLNNHISIKHQFADIKKIRPCGVMKALKKCGFEFTGTQHRAIDDARNISKIFLEIFNELKF